ncbi:AAA family ATPase [Chitinophaga agri]|uniref:AAA family ATPase n=1 Tax=Chitinophaga agri TaxID=2703787 RepID=A0A6B9Z993_9BACT|nr:AAA family ATPase [Chitinophaga agri]QHS58141.1 AAA family ATPase [Chitinophaga agri]
MKILAIRLKNLASLEDTNEIDFTKEPLSKAGIFAITGPTGAGKSTLLDALCLALYAKTPRYQQAKETGVEIQDRTGNKLNQGDIRGILRDGTADGFAEVSFAGIDGHNYRATWSVKRARNKIDGNLQTDTVELFNLSTNTPVPGKKTETLREIERVVGLNFEQFTRSVLLAQGDFTAFLKADKDAKASLLEKLTGTNIYSEISVGVFEKFKEADTELKQLKQQIAGIVSLSEEERTSFTEQQSTLTASIATQQQTINTLNAEINWHQLLGTLQDNRNVAAGKYTEALTAIENAADSIRTFTQVEQVQPARGPVEARRSYERELSVKEAALAEITNRIVQTTERQQQAMQALSEADTAVQEQQQAAAASQPDIERARHLDTLIGEKAQRVSLAKAAADVAEKKQQDHLKVFENKEQEITVVTATIEKLQQWQRDHLGKKDIAENDIEIRTQLSHAASLLPRQQEALREQQDNSSFIKKAQEQITALQEKVLDEQQQLSDLQKAFDTLHVAIGQMPVDALKDQQSSLIQHIREGEAAKGHWDLLLSNLQEKEHTVRLLENCQQELLEKTTVLKDKKAQLIVAQTQKDLTDKLLQQARLQIAENVEALRAQLIQDEPCPVCGSTAHPFAGGNPVEHTILLGLEEEYKKALQTYNSLQGDISTLEQLTRKLDTDGSMYEGMLARRSEQITSLEKTWMTFSLATASQTLPAESRKAWLAARVQELHDEHQQTTQQLQAYEEKRKEADQLKIQLDALQHKLTATGDSLKDRQREKSSKEEAQRHIEKQLANITESLHTMTELLAPHFNNPAWIDNWKKDPQGFDNSIRAFAVQWKEHVQAITDNTQLLREHQSALQEMSKQGPLIAAELNERIHDLNTQQTQFDTLTQERQRLLNGAAVSVFEQRLKQAMDNAVATQQAAAKELNNLREELRGYTVSREQTSADINNIHHNIAQISAAIKEWLDAYASTDGVQLSEPDLTSLLAYSAAWIDTERKTINALRTAVTTTKATLEERELQVTNHLQKRTSERGLEEVTALAGEARQTLEQLSAEKSKVDYKLWEDKKNKDTIGGLQKNIEAKTAIHENWGRLNELIGSADGKKFRQIAQEYTLDILLGYANMHLAMLTTRYKLQRIPGTLGLQILDKDMGDELRTVFSLSGGESFLVSLALALGLASLSSSKMKVESLFIDEGFGALDPDTLNVAVDALERLHNQGRKVGVISHVQEMTERIPAQIKVIRMANGKSTVEVVGG